jgi:hypothetical protein
MVGFNQQPGPRIGIITVLQEALYVVQTKLSDEIDTINTWATDNGITQQIARPADGSIFTWMTYPKFVDSYPALMLVPYQTRSLDHSIAAPHQDEYKLAHSWAIDVLEQGSDWGDITARLELWAAAIFEVFADTDCLPCGHTLFEGADWNQPRMTRRDSGDLLQDLPFGFTTQTFEYTNPTPS